MPRMHLTLSVLPPRPPRALGDIGNLVGGFHQKVNVGKEGAGDADAKSQGLAQVRVRWCRARPEGRCSRRTVPSLSPRGLT